MIKSLKYLGVITYNELSQEEHTEMIKSKIFKTSGVFYKTKQVLNEKFLYLNKIHFYRPNQVWSVMLGQN